MAATYDEIKSWLTDVPEGTTHVVIVCDTYDWEDYPCYVGTGEGYFSGSDVNEVIDKHNGKNMQKIMEVYSFTGKYTLEEQLAERRAYHTD